MAAEDARADAPAYMLPGVNLFASGLYRGRHWPAAVVRRMAANARKLGPSGLKLLVPPSVPGHEEDDGWQEWVDPDGRTDLPAAGWVDPDSVHVVDDPQYKGHVLLRGDVVNVPAEMAAKIRSSEYATGSCEVYDDFLDDFGHGYGKTIRRFNYLGGEVPQVKRLGRLPTPVPMTAVKQFAERGRVVIRVRRVERDGRVLNFAEGVVMDRQSMIAAITAAMPNLARATLDALNDDQLADLAKNVPSPTAAPVPPSGAMADMTHEELIQALTDLEQDPTALAGMSDEELQALYDELSGAGGNPDAAGDVTTMGDPATMTREELVAELVAAGGQDQAALEAMTDDELRAAYAQITAATPGPATPAAVAPMGEPRTVPNRGGMFAELPQVKKLVANAAKLNRFAEAQIKRSHQIARELKRQKIHAFGEEMVKAGRFLPWQRDIICSLMHHLDDTHTTHRFSEGGKTTRKTALDLVMANCRKGAPVIRFGERLPSGELGGQGSKESVVARAKRFAEVQAGALRAAGYKTPEAFVVKFSEMYDKNPESAVAILPPEFRA